MYIIKIIVIITVTFISHTITSTFHQQTLKKQEQTVKDLRQTLQRELKVQALPNDDASDDNTSSPLPGRKFPQRQAAVPVTSVSPQPFVSGHSSAATITPTSSVVLSMSTSSAASASATAAVKPMTLTSVMQVSICLFCFVCYCRTHLFVKYQSWLCSFQYSV